MVNLEENLSNMTSTKFPKYRTIWQYRYRYDLDITVPVYTGTVGMVPGTGTGTIHTLDK